MNKLEGLKIIKHLEIEEQRQILATKSAFNKLGLRTSDNFTKITVYRAVKL